VVVVGLDDALGNAKMQFNDNRHQNGLSGIARAGLFPIWRVDDRKGILRMNQKLTDLQIKAQTAILNDERTKKHGIEVLEDGGAIRLKGTVPSRKVKKIAESIIRELGDTVKVDNKLEVKGDDEILERILR
jgi:hypothetical protein